MTTSVALCTCNGIEFLAKQLDSIIRQTKPVDEIIICDDGSTDLARNSVWQYINSSKKDMIRQTILSPIVQVMEEWSLKNNVTHPAFSFFKKMIISESCIRKNRLDRLNEEVYSPLLDTFSKNAFLSGNNLALGLQNGLAGLGLSLLTELDGDDSWVSLLPDDFKTTKNESLPV